MASTRCDSALPREIRVEQDSQDCRNTNNPLIEENDALVGIGAEEEIGDDISDMDDTSSIVNLSCCDMKHEDVVNARVSKRTRSHFDCNICLDTVDEPVVTRCGHLYCWPCLYQWLEPGVTPRERRHLSYEAFTHSNAGVTAHDEADRIHSSPTVNMLIDLSRRCCPVCKSECTVQTVTPIYVEGNTDKQQVQSNARTTPLRPHPVSVPSPDDVEPMPTRGVTENTAFHRQSIVPVLLGMHPSILRTNSSNSNTSLGSNLSSQETENYLSIESDTNEFLSRLLLLLGSFVIFVLLLF